MTPSPPNKLGRYEVLEEIGKGAMGVVYLARDPLIGRLVALKTFRIGFSAKDHELQQFRSRFVREAQSAGILSHPNIVTIHDVVDEGADGTCFIAMEFVKGTNLKQLLQRPEPFTNDFLVGIVAQIAEALDYAHSRGVVHRDIKPANILITPDEKVKITDFGIARLDTSNLTMEGQLLGTPNYMAPEQILGKEVDHRADIFSLGVVFYEMLTRRKPFQGENLTAVTHKIVYEPFTPPEEIVRDLPAGLASVLNRCLEKDPNRRFPRAAEIAKELRRALADEQQDLDDTSATQEVEPLEQQKTRRMPVSEILAHAAPPPVAPSTPPAPPTPASAPAAPSRQGTQAAKAAMGPAASTPPAGATGATPAATRTRAPAAAGAPVSPAAASVAPKPPSAPPAEAVVGAAPPTGWRRWLWIGIGAAAAAVAAVVAVVWLTASSPATSNVAPAPAPEQQHRITAATALAEARTHLAMDNLQAALQAVARAELAAPDSVDARRLREEIDARSREIVAASDLDRQVAEGMIAAREAYAKRRYDDAVTFARSVLELRPEEPEAHKLLADAELARDRQRERQRLAREAAAATPTPVPTAVRPTPTPQPTPAAVAPPVARDAGLRIAFQSDTSEGTLTIYAGERQILREQFRFVRKTGFLRSEKISGTLAVDRELPPGATTMRIYVSISGKPTRAVTVDGILTPGGQHVLTIRVDADGVATASFQ